MLSGGVSLAKSGIVPIGRGFPAKSKADDVDAGEVNLHLLPTNQNSSDNYGSHCSNKTEKQQGEVDSFCKTEWY